MKAIPLTRNEITEKLKILEGWNQSKNHIEKEFLFKDFKSAFNFMQSAAEECEAINHHPEWTNVYNKVHVKLSTHSLKKISSLDIILAEKMNTIFTNGI